MKQQINIADIIETAQFTLGREVVTAAIQKYVADNYHLDLTKAVYGVSGNTLNNVSVEVKKRLSETDTSIKSIRPTISAKVIPTHKKHEKVNKGLYGALRALFEAERKRGVKTLNFEELYELVKVEYPHLEPSRLGLYLYDERQFPNIEYNRVAGTVDLKKKK